MKLSVSTAIFKASFLNAFEENNYEVMFKKVIQSGYDEMECIPISDINTALKNSIKYLKSIIKVNNQFNG
jgi:sugar phosphate isomerase/epimerase